MAKKKPTPEAETEGGAAPKKSKKKLMVVALIVILGAGAFGYMTMTKKAVAAGKGAPTTTVPGWILEKRPLTANLRENHSLQFTAALEVATGKTYTVFVTAQPIVLDIL